MIKDGQNILDVTLQAYGSIEFIFDLIKHNDYTMSSEMASGMEVKTDSSLGNKNIKKYYEENNVIPANNVNSVIQTFVQETSYTADSTAFTADSTTLTADQTGSGITVYETNYNSDFSFIVVYQEQQNNIVDQNIVYDNQNLFDVTIQRYGNIDQVFEIIKKNNLTLNSELSSGMYVNYLQNDKGDKEIKSYFSNKKIIPVNTGEFIAAETNALTADTTEYTADSTQLTADQTIIDE